VTGEANTTPRWGKPPEKTASDGGPAFPAPPHGIRHATCMQKAMDAVRARSSSCGG